MEEIEPVVMKKQEFECEEAQKKRKGELPDFLVTFRIPMQGNVYSNFQTNHFFKCSVFD